LSIIETLRAGNDTIDPYPLIPRGAAKILCITPVTFVEISRAFREFRNFIKRPISRKVEPKQTPKPRDGWPKTKRQADYEPTNAIYVNECDYRRWCRVNEWFSEFGPNAEKSERAVLIQ
jgi:hypothetical protein